MFPTRTKALRACVRVRRAMGRDLRFRVWKASGRRLGWLAAAVEPSGRLVGYLG